MMIYYGQHQPFSALTFLQINILELIKPVRVKLSLFLIVYTDVFILFEHFALYLTTFFNALSMKFLNIRIEI